MSKEIQKTEKVCSKKHHSLWENGAKHFAFLFGKRYPYLAPSCVNTIAAVLKIIFKSSKSERVSMYSIS